MKFSSGWIYLIPALFLLLWNSIIPTLYVAWASTQRWYLTGLTITYVGLENYYRVLKDPTFIFSLGRTFTFMIICIAIEIVFGIVVAFLLLEQFRGNKLLQSVISIPFMIPPIAIGATWKLMLLPGRGPVPYLLSSIAGVNFDITTNGLHAFLAVIIMDVWHWTPFVALFIGAALSAVPLEYVESATVDGAKSYMRFRYVILPMIKQQLLLVILLRAMDLFRIFDEVWFLTGGGPGTATSFISIYLIRQILAEWNVGAGSVSSLVLLYVTLMLCWGALLIARIRR